MAMASTIVAGTASAATPTLTLNPSSGGWATAFTLTPASTQCAATANTYQTYLIASSQATSDADIFNNSQGLFDATTGFGLSGTLAAGNMVPQPLTTSFAASSAQFTVAAAGQYQVGILCFTQAVGSTPPVFTNDWFTTVTFNAAGGSSATWSTSSTTNPVGTSTALAATPASPAAHGATETLTATVTAASGSSIPVGSVDFKDGSTDLGSAAVNSSGVATTTATLADGSHSLTAAFTPTDSTAFAASTSTAVPYTVSPAQLGSGSESVTVTIPQAAGSFSMSVPSTGNTLTVSADGATASGSLAAVSVSDTRASSAGWTVSGQAGSFTSSGGGSFSGDALGWAPALATGSTGPVTAGPTVAPNGPGLGTTPGVLGSATGDSAASLGATLNLAIPTGQAAGTYTSTITITAI
jgi:hypothetical protein